MDQNTTTDLLNKIEDRLEAPTRKIQSGEAKISVRESGIYLLVVPPGEGGSPADWLTVQKQLEAKGIVDYDVLVIREALEAKTGEPVLVAPRKPELDRDAEATVVVEDNGMAAYLEVVPALGGLPLTRDIIKKILEDNKIREGIKTEMLPKILQFKGAGRFLIAEGTPPVNGVDATISYKFDIDPTPVPVELADGSVDYRNLNLIQNVKAGDVLAERIPPVAGFPGKNVYGQQIKPEGGKNLRLPKGANTIQAEDDENLLISKIEGQAVFKDGKVHVFPVLTINGDVDLETGNVDFVGSVIIQGGVRSGFAIHASGNVEIKGSVEAATIIADGDVVLQRGMQGADTGQIIAKAVTAKFLEHCKVKAKQEIVVNDAVMYCDLEAGQRVQVTGKLGRLVGGTALAGEEIQARTIGSKLGMKTEVEVGVNPEVRKELTQLYDELKQREQQYKMVANGLTRVKQELQAGKVLNQIDNERITKLIETHQVLKEQINEMEQKKTELEEIMAHSKKGRILIFDRVYPGVKVAIGSENLIIQDEIQNVSFYLDGKELCQGSAV